MIILACTILCPNALAIDPPDDAAPVAQPLVPPDPAAFADSLLAGDDPYNALTWYRYALFQDPTRPDAASIAFRAAWCYELGERWQGAELAYGDLASAYPELATRAAWRQAVVLAHGGEMTASDAAFEELRLLWPESEWAGRAAYAQGVLHLQAYDLEGAALAFDRAAQPEAAPLLQERASTLASGARAPVPHRPPALAAGASAVLPGLGQAIAGHWGDAGMALAANGSLAFLAGSLLGYGVREDKAWAGAAGAVVAGGLALTWSSNVVGAWRGAERFNLHQQRRAAEYLLPMAWEPSLELRADEVKVPTP